MATREELDTALMYLIREGRLDVVAGIATLPDPVRRAAWEAAGKAAASDPVEAHLAWLGRCNACMQPLEEHNDEDTATCAEILRGIAEDEAQAACQTARPS